MQEDLAFVHNTGTFFMIPLSKLSRRQCRRLIDWHPQSRFWFCTINVFHSVSLCWAPLCKNSPANHFFLPLFNTSPQLFPIDSCCFLETINYCPWICMYLQFKQLFLLISMPVHFEDFHWFLQETPHWVGV